MWNYLILVGQIALREYAKQTFIPSSLMSLKSIYQTTKSIKDTKKLKKVIVSKAISGVSSLSPTPLRSSLNYALKTKYKGETLDTKHIKELIKTDTKKSLLNQFIPKEIRYILSLLNKADKYLEKKIREAERLERRQIKERIAVLNKQRREVLQRLREIKREVDRYLIDQRKIARIIIKERRELFKKVQKQIKEEIRIQKKINKQIKEDIERRYKQFDKNVRLFHKHLANVAYEENNKGSYNDFFDFVDTLNATERNNLRDLLHKYTTVRISFNSKWIKAAMWEPLINIREYKDQVGLMTKMSKGGTKKVFSNSAKGILKIIVKRKYKSQWNPKRLYSWYNVSFGTWKKIIAHKTGTNFWKVFYHRARTNKRYITSESKYYKSHWAKIKRPNKKVYNL